MQTGNPKMRLAASDGLRYIYRVMGTIGKTRDKAQMPLYCIASRLTDPLNLDRTCFCYITLWNPVFDKIAIVGTIEPISSDFSVPLSHRKFVLVPQMLNNRWRCETDGDVTFSRSVSYIFVHGVYM